MPNTIAQLTKELAETKTYLNTLIEKEQAANEELKSASEEILSSNEELQSTNQELQTSKEEIQSANSAIESINATLKKRNFELTEAHSDLSNTLSSAQVAIIMLSNDLTCRRITPAADRALMLHDPAPGRSITEIMANFEIPDFDKMILNVIDTLSAKKLETQDKSGRWYELSIRPYRTIDNKIDGAVIVLNDINENKRSLIRLEDSQEYGAAIIGTVPVPLLVLDADLRVKSANQCFIESFGIEEDQTTNQLMYEMGRGEWDVPELREFLENILPEKRILRNYVLDRVFPHVGHRVLNLSARRLIQQEQKVPMILLAIEDVSAEHKAKLELKEAKDASDAANKAKSNFLASMSHEIRTPLGIMLGYSDMIYNDAKNKMDRRYFAETIRRNGQHLLAIINDVLDLSKVEAGKLEIDLVRFQLVPKLNDIVDQFMQRAKERGIFLEFKITGSIPDTVTTDPVRLRQILVNILGNAIKFTDKGGVSVDVTMRNPNDAGSQKLVFTITDSGCGIAETCQEKIFNPFTQAESYITRRYGGTGLGLGLAQKLARCLGGDVVLMSSEIGKGSIFIASIDAGDTKSATWIDDVAYKEISQRGSAESPSDSAKVAVEMRLSGIRVLLVDDFEDNQKLIRLMLENVGAQVEVANDGADGVKKALAGHFDIVLMDIQMPVMTGYEATATLRVKGYSQPIVALTAHAMKGELERCIASGCDGYIAKPITKEQLILSIEQHLADDQSITGGNFTEIADSAGDAKIVQSIKKSQSTEDSPLVSTIPITDPTYEVVQQIVSRLSQYVASFQRHLNQCDWTALRDLAHQMKGLGGGIGFPVLTEVARDLEVEAKNDPPNVPRLVALVGEFTALVRRINV
jgi:two-component system CheB/CheR fusion protein